MKPENTFIKSVDKHIPLVYGEKMANPWRSGTADKWYSGVKGDMWIEYKWIEKIPLRAEVLADVSPRQNKWLQDRAAEGRNVYVVLGCPEGGVVFTNGAWNTPLDPVQFRKAVLTRPQIAEWIFGTTGASPCLSNASPSLRATSSGQHTKASSRRCSSRISSKE